jgi:predicted nucleic acid-binding protein
LLTELDLGEAETIILAKELNADFVIIDENLGYKIANNAGLTTIRTLSILLKAKEKGHIENIKPILDELIVKGRWYSNRVYQTCLLKAGEW